MKQEILTRFPWPWLPSIALLIFFVFFVGMVIRLQSKSRRKLLQRAAHLPLDEADKYFAERDLP